MTYTANRQVDVPTQTQVSLLRVLMISTSFPATSQDWPGRFIANIAEALARRPDVKLALWAPPGEHSDSIKVATTLEDAEWLCSLLKLGGIAHLLRSQPLRGGIKSASLLYRLHRIYRQYNDINVVHVNWLQNALPLWGCHHPAVISVLGNDFGLLRLPGMVSVLRAVLRGRRVVLAPNAEWMVKDLKGWFGDLASVCPIPFGVDNLWFTLERKWSSCSTPQWLAVTRLTARKIGNLFLWGQGLFDSQRQLHLFGPLQEDLILPHWVNYHGPASPKALIEEWFPNATGLVTLSQHDEGRPQVILEAMAAGLPVVASDLPAHRDLVQSGKTGILVNSPVSFAAALKNLETPYLNNSLGESARLWIREKIGTWDDCARRYNNAYRSVAGV